ncbi:MAG: FecR domain-containing protein [Bryobacteraceae bacterium]|jgi:hypothetical protein
MTPDMDPMDLELERAMVEIRDQAVDDAAIEAAAARVWARLTDVAGPGSAEHIRGCADFRALFPEYRAGSLPEARALLLKDHLNQCVACRRVYEGKLVAFPRFHPELAAVRQRRHAYRWAAAAVVVAAAGVSVWVVRDRFTPRQGRASIQAVNGALYAFSAAGVQLLAVGQDLPEGVEIRTAKDSDAMVQLGDGSTLELRERSSFSASQSGADITVRLGRGSVIVQAAKRRSGHLYVATGDCRAAVTGTVFSVDAGVKGSRISVIQGEVRVTEDNQEKVLRPGDQTVTGSNLENVPIQDDVSWSLHGEKLGAKPAPAPAGQASALLSRAPASTALFALLPDAAEASRDAMASLRQAALNPQLRTLLKGGSTNVEPLVSKLEAASEYLGEAALAMFVGADNQPQGPVFLATVKRAGFRDFLAKTGLTVMVEERPGLVVFGPRRETVTAFARTLDGPPGGFETSPCYARLAEARSAGSGTALCADLARFGQIVQGARYLVVEDRRVNGRPEIRATVGFEGPRTGIAAWLAPPAPMGALDYVSPDATFLAAFVVKNPASTVDELFAFQRLFHPGSQKALAEARQQDDADRNELAASLGGEFALALDGPLFPTPSWRLIAEVYDPVRFQATLEKLIGAYNREAPHHAGAKPLRTARETVDGRTYYMIGSGDPNPLLEAHYAYDDGYFVAGPTRAAVSQAFQAKTARTSIARSSLFLSLTPRDRYANFSAVIYQNLGPTLAPLAGLLGAFAPIQAGGRGSQVAGLENLKATLLAAYGEPDRITIAGSGEALGMRASDFATGSLLGIAGNALPLGQFFGTRGRQSSYRK